MMIAQMIVVDPNNDAIRRGPMISVARLAKPEKNTRVKIRIMVAVKFLVIFTLVVGAHFINGYQF